MKNSFVIDTMALILRLEERKLSERVKSIFKDAEKGDLKLIIPVMVLAEIGYLAEKRKIDTNLEDVRKYCLKNISITIEPLTQKIIEKAFEINDIPELHDRIIAGTAFEKELNLVTNDPRISSSKFVKVVW